MSLNVWDFISGGEQIFWRNLEFNILDADCSGCFRPQSRLSGGWGCREMAWGLKMPLEQEQELGTGQVGNSQACCSAASVEAFLFWCALESHLCGCMGVVVSLSSAQGIPSGPALCRAESLSFLLDL